MQYFIDHKNSSSTGGQGETFISLNNNTSPPLPVGELKAKSRLAKKLLSALNDDDIEVPILRESIKSSLN
jgi:hypothetical protein